MEPSDQNSPEKDWWETFTDYCCEVYQDFLDTLCSWNLMHDYGDWQYLEEGDCRSTKVCNRCEKHLKGKIKHTYGEAKILEEHSCAFYKTCARCNHQEQVQIKHMWGKWGPSKQKKSWTFQVGRLREIYRFLKKHTQQDIKQICGLMGIEYEDLTGEVKSAKIQELLNVCIAQKRIPELLEIIPESINGLKRSHKKRLSEIQDDLELVEMQYDQKEFSWEFDPELSCLQDRICGRCGEIESREEHIWGTWNYVSEESCEQIRYCQCCGKAEVSTQQAHKWGKLEYDADHSCTMSRTCLRCKEKQLEAKEDHDWEPHPCGINQRCRRCKTIENTPNSREFHDWVHQEDPAKPCTFHIHCRKCSKPKPSRTLHNWGVNQVEGCSIYRQCSRCGKQKALGSRCNWGPWVPQIGTLPIEQRICNACGEMEEQYAE